MQNLHSSVMFRKKNPLSVLQEWKLNGSIPYFKAALPSKDSKLHFSGGREKNGIYLLN